MLAVIILALLGFTLAYAIPHPWGIVAALAVPVVLGIATLATEGADGFAWATWLVTLVVVAAAAIGGRVVRERYGPGGGRAASAR